jgi:hypothetical protein
MQLQTPPSNIEEARPVAGGGGANLKNRLFSALGFQPVQGQPE